MNYETVMYDKSAPVATITLNRPQKLNAINDLLLIEIESALGQAEEDDDIRYVVLKGAGRCFSVGQDLSGEGTDEVMPPDPRLRSSLTPVFKAGARVRKRWQCIFDCSKHLIAAVHGYCLGMGCDLMMMCHTSIAAQDAIFGDPSVRMGYASANPLWTWRVGLKRAKDLLLTGRYIGAREAYDIGLVTLVVPTDELDAEVDMAIEAIDRGMGGIAGADAIVPGMQLTRASFDMAGLAGAWDFSAGLHGISAVQRRGFAPGEFNFFEARGRLGTKGAIMERDAPYAKLFPVRPIEGGGK